MSTVKREVRIDAPYEKVWSTMANFGDIYTYNPGVPHSYLTSEQETGVGTTRHCDLAFAGASIEERILEWNEGDSYTLEIFDGKKLPPVEYIRVTLAARPHGEGAIASTYMEYKLKYGPVGALMDRLMVHRQMAQGMEGLLAGLKFYSETGQPVDSPKEINTAAVAVPA